MLKKVEGGGRSGRQMMTEALKLNVFAPWKKSYDQSRENFKMQRHYFAKKGPSSQGYGFSSSHVWMLRVGL